MFWHWPWFSLHMITCEFNFFMFSLLFLCTSHCTPRLLKAAKSSGKRQRSSNNFNYNVRHVNVIRCRLFPHARFRATVPFMKYLRGVSVFKSMVSRSCSSNCSGRIPGTLFRKVAGGVYGPPWRNFLVSAFQEGWTPRRAAAFVCCSRGLLVPCGRANRAIYLAGKRKIFSRDLLTFRIMTFLYTFRTNRTVFMHILQCSLVSLVYLASFKTRQ